MLARRFLLALAVTLVVTLAFACGGDSDDGDGNGDVENGVEETATPVSSGLGSLAVETEEAGVGEEVTVAGQGWRDTEPVTFYLAGEAETQNAALAVTSGTVPELGEATAGADGSLEFSFQLEASYPVAEGTLTVSPGDELWVFALQPGGTGTLAGPFTVR